MSSRPLPDSVRAVATCLVVQHVPAEGPGLIAGALEGAGVDLEVRRMGEEATLPRSLDGFDGLVVMGGPMSARSDEGFPWRRDEIGLFEQAVNAGIPALGVCLGAQLLAVASGGQVVAGGSGLEVGWAPVALQADAATDPLLSGLPRTPTVLHWHGETVRLPIETTILASNDRYRIQAFRAGRSAWGLQFHLEVDEETVAAFVAAFPYDADAAPGGGAEVLRRTPAALADLEPFRSVVLGRFAQLVAGDASAVTPEQYAVTEP